MSAPTSRFPRLYVAIPKDVKDPTTYHVDQSDVYSTREEAEVDFARNTNAWAPKFDLFEYKPARRVRPREG